jgi:hypothetical protein
LTEAGPPHDNTPLAADDVIGSLAARVRELSLRVAQLEGELEAAKRAIAVFEDFDTQVQDSLSAALRAANQIRERARVTAEALAQEARAQQPANATELAAMRVERDTLRRVIDEASSGVPSRAGVPVASVPLSEMRSAATEALRGVFKDLVDEIRASTQPPAAAQAAAPAPAPAFSAPPVQRQSPPAPAPSVAAAPAPPAYGAAPPSYPRSTASDPRRSKMSRRRRPPRPPRRLRPPPRRLRCRRLLPSPPSRPASSG